MCQFCLENDSIVKDNFTEISYSISNSALKHSLSKSPLVTHLYRKDE
jgi:hypothetical protein